MLPCYRLLVMFLLSAAFTWPAVRSAEPSKPKIRTITGFITINPKSYRLQIAESVKFLSQVRAAIQARGYEVSGIRISTQPFPQYTRGLRRADALALLRGIN